ncbi:Mus7/MMS22 family-domain-containing protein [Suillus subaureus]|uniref:Mus7/MMS22 family-domain-containing protein n=1 Tax=Suillus subaureus TaxID=48587 RepID=A0A9P7JAT9_9AGAM|nr:Mus7/MMS22 family-domain-containing protein [Suillus subaureus]KAG1811430.1 Mus7/MMS22 family-domain-containing protein [Suillus subaureus]
MDLDEVVDTSDAEEREFDISEADCHTCFSPKKTRLNSRHATKLHGRFNDRQEGQPSPRKRVKTTHSESELQLIIDLSSSSHASPVKPTTSSALFARATHSPMRAAFNPASNLSLPAAGAHEASSHNETRSTDTQEPSFNDLGILPSLIPAESENLSYHPITSVDVQQQADHQLPLPDSSQPQLDDALFPSSPTSVTFPSQALAFSQSPAPLALSQHEGLVSNSSPSISRPADSWSLFSSPPGPSTQSSQGPIPKSIRKHTHMPRDSPPRTPHPSDHRSPSPDELLLISPESRSKRLLTPITPIAQDPSSPAVQSRDRLPLPPPPPVPPPPPLVIPEDPEPVSRYSLRRREARQLQPYAFDKAQYKAQMKANPDAIVKFVSPQRREMHGEDGSQWADGETQGGTQAKYIFPVDNPEEDRDYVDVEGRRRKKRVTIAELDHDNREREEGWLPEALRDLSESDEIEGTDEVRKLVREAKRARKKAEAEAKKREKEEALLRAQEEAAGRETAKKRRLKNFPLEASSSKQPVAGPSSASSRRTPSRLDEWSPPVLSRLLKGKQRATSFKSHSPARNPLLTDEYEYQQDDDYDYYNFFDHNDHNSISAENVNPNTDNDAIEIPSAPSTPPRSSSTLPDGDDHLDLSDDPPAREPCKEFSSLSPEISSKDRKRFRLLQRMMPTVMIKKQLEQQGSKMKILANTKRARSPTPSDIVMLWFRETPRARMSKFLEMRTWMLMHEVSDIVSQVRASPKVRSRSPVISISSSSGSVSESDDEDSDGMIDDARIDAWSRSRRPMREKSLIDWMLTRTRTVGGGRKQKTKSSRRSRGSGVKSRDMGESRSGRSRPKLNIVTGGARMGNQTLLSFPTVSSDYDRRSQHSHHNKVHKRTESTTPAEHESKALRKEQRKKKRKQAKGELYSFHQSGTRIARRGLRIDLGDEGFHQVLDPTWRKEMDRWQKQPGSMQQRASSISSRVRRDDAQSKRQQILFSRVDSKPQSGVESSQDERQRKSHARPRPPPSRVDSRRSHVDFDFPLDPLRERSPPVRRKGYNDVHEFIHAVDQRTLLTTVDLGIDILPSGIAFSVGTYIGRGFLHQLICLITGHAQPVAPMSYVIRGFDLGPDTSVHVLTTVIAPLCDQLADDVLKEHEWTAAVGKDWELAMRTVCQLVSWLCLSIDDQEFSSLELTVHETMGSLVARVLEADIHHFSLPVCWFAVELAARIMHAARTRRGSSETRELFKFALLLMRPLSDADLREILASFKEPDGPLETNSTPVQAVESWICLFHLLINCMSESPGKLSSEPFWLLFKQLIQDEASSFATAVEASEYNWRNIFSFCALSQFSVHGMSTSLSRITPSWETVLATLKLISLVADPQKDALTHTASLNKRDEYVSIIASRCFLLWKRWHWSLDDAMTMFNHLVEIFRSRRFASLRHEQPKFMQFMVQRDISLLSVQDRGDNVFELRKQDSTSDVEKKHRDIQVKKMLNMVVPVGSVSSTRAVQPTGQESSMLFNRLNAMAVAIHLDPSISNVRHRVGQARRCVNFKDAHDFTRAVCIRGIEHICAVMRHHRVQLGEILSWLAEVTGILLDEYQEARILTNKDNKNIVKNKTVEMVKSLLTSVVRMIEICSLDTTDERHEYPNPAFLEGPWVKDVFSPKNPIAIENDSSAACQELVSAFLDARMRALPRPTALPISPSVDNQESQDEYDKFFIDLNDPAILAALGDEPAQTSGMEWKRKEEAVCGPLASAIFRVVCRYVVDSPAPSTVDSRRETADRWIDCWVGVGNVLVQNGSSWKNHMHLGPESWERIPDPLWRRRVGLRFCLALLRLDSKAYHAYEDYFIEVLLTCTVPFKTTIEHEYASIVFTLDGLRHPLLRGVLAEPSTGSSTFEISLEEYLTVRQTLIESVFANLADRLQNNIDPVNYKYLGFLVSMLSAMRDNYESLLSGEERVTYAEFCRKVFRSLLSRKALAIQPRLSELIQWGKTTIARAGDDDGDQPMES